MLAQASRTPAVNFDVTNAVGVALGCAVFLAMLTIGVLVLKAWRRRLREKLDAGMGRHDDVFSVETLERLLSERQITLDEYRRLRRARLGLKPEKDPPADSNSSPPAADVDGQ